jgi:hypothetical protein
MAEAVLALLTSSLGHWDVNPRGPAGESRESRLNDRKGIDEENSDCG